MIKRKEKKHFAMSYNRLINLSHEKEALFMIDEPVLNVRDITIARIAAFVNLRNAFMNILPNETKRAQVTIDKEKRDRLMNELRAALKEVWGIAATTFGIKSVEYKTLGSTSVSLLKVVDLYSLASKVVSRANFYLVEMQPKGLTAAMLTNITTLQENMANASINTSLTKVKRTNTTDERNAAANNLYDEMKAMCKTAFVYFENRDKLKANQYIIYKVAGKLQQRNGKLKIGTTICPKLKRLSEDSEFKLMAESGNTLAFYFSKTNAGIAGAKQVVVPVNATNFTIVTANNLGFNSSKGYIHFCIKNMGDIVAESVYKIRIKG